MDTNEKQNVRKPRACKRTKETRTEAVPARRARKSSIKRPATLETMLQANATYSAPNVTSEQTFEQSNVTFNQTQARIVQTNHNFTTSIQEFPDLITAHSRERRGRRRKSTNAPTTVMDNVQPPINEQTIAIVAPLPTTKHPGSLHYNTRRAQNLATAPTMEYNQHWNPNKAIRPLMTPFAHPAHPTHPTQQMIPPPPVAHSETSQHKVVSTQTEQRLSENEIKFIKVIRSKKLDISRIIEIIKGQDYISTYLQTNEENNNQKDITLSSEIVNQIVSSSVARKIELFTNYLSQMYKSNSNTPMLPYVNQIKAIQSQLTPPLQPTVQPQPSPQRKESTGRSSPPVLRSQSRRGRKTQPATVTSEEPPISSPNTSASQQQMPQQQTTSGSPASQGIPVLNNNNMTRGYENWFHNSRNSQRHFPNFPQHLDQNMNNQYKYFLLHAFAFHMDFPFGRPFMPPQNPFGMMQLPNNNHFPPWQSFGN